MKIYTSYFGNSKKLAQANIKMISISRYKPKFFYGCELKTVAPTSKILFGNLSTYEYEKRYRRDVLNWVNAKEFLRMIESVSNGNDVALCCYEKPEDFCHRHILAEWIKEETGLEIKEFGLEPVKEIKPQAEQLSLF